ncbi:cell surface glycoprotein CD200 receptor 2-like isoform X1 [Anser cygnoides]|uniref:Ig-like domain-containing protein n=2 Tax=Anser cygnoides TaxID=8845 RepID=A0A8B9DQS0_ANSCY|nr:cell surface glycoprotein CD200 receptor 2-like isoform X1 [Anser cygnoides]XP_047927598.1 cell surface glycoprotein CD200 receptor 2-like isoform X1 [Anser cygnoides]XP_047927599.1 cell surface glycoprotein CD200 receptor 2-like isoform X1 [Anser cygnoides]XP_047927600.1 cell surface glycoprotein CD200 receptor 2-like isoform X1 [Anser cygnoides]XP_047927601.1 cell surface glycoprotein CD200 receptor 2-like isoform X1 [Anser cygnoides]
MAQTWSVLAALLFLIFSLVEGSAYNIVNVEAGHEAVLTCASVSKLYLIMVTWEKKSNASCSLAYRNDLNETRKLNCSERMMWKYTPDRDPALRIYPVNLSDEGNYTCEIASDMGNFHFSSSLSVIVPPTVTLTSDKSRVAVCQAAAGKPAAKISWIPASNNSSEEEFKHGNGTVTRVSYIGWVNSTHTTVTCLVTHPALNQNLSLDLSYSSSRLHYPLVALPASVAAMSGVGVLLCLIFTFRAFRLRKLAHGPPVPVATENFRSTPSHKNTPEVNPHVSEENIYQNYGAGNKFMNY